MKLELKEIYKNFGSKEVLKGVSLRAESGQAIGLLGRNGAGKTTTIRILMDVFHADSGEILIDDKPISYDKITFGYLPEERGLYPKKKIIEQLVYFTQLKGLSKADATKSINRYLKKLQMSEYRDKRLDTLSKGNQQKIQLVTALAHDPDIIILDEPFSGLDPVNAQLLKDVVKEQIRNGKIVLFSSHQMNYIEEFCDSIAILNGGQIVLSGDLEQIKREYPRDRLVVRSPQSDAIRKAYPESVPYEKYDNALLLPLSSESAKGDAIRDLAERFELDEIRVYEPSLNDIFVQYAKEQI